MFHFQQDPEFEFRNFNPDPSVNASVNATLCWLMEVMPSDATVTAHLSKIGSQYLCKVHVVSSLGFFRGEAHDFMAQEAVDKAVAAVRESLKSWHHAHIGIDGESYVELMTH